MVAFEVGRNCGLFSSPGEVVLEDKASGDRTAIDRTYVDFWSKQPDGKWLCTRHTFVVLGVREL
jgi:ketosteroid isomerase-like protein